MTREVTVQVLADPAVWLTGPRDPAEALAWVDGAESAVAQDFGLDEPSDLRTYLRGVLEAFATASTVSPFRFLRMRSLADAPLVARVDVEQHDAASSDPLMTFEVDRDWYDHAPAVVDLGDGWRRAIRMYVDDGVRTAVRFHRHDPVHGVDILVSCVGFDMMAVATGMGDLNDLARSVEVGQA